PAPAALSGLEEQQSTGLPTSGHGRSGRARYGWVRTAARATDQAAPSVANRSGRHQSQHCDQRPCSATGDELFHLWVLHPNHYISLLVPPLNMLKSLRDLLQT